jgi:FkbM family methyltransferase
MNFKLLVGKTLHSAFHGLLANRRFPLLPRTALGLSWPYDIARFAGTRDLGMFLDVGANTGQTCDQILAYFPKARIHAFEPISATFAELKQNVGDRPRVSTHQVAMGRQPGSLRIQLQGDSQLNSLLYASQPGLADTGKFEEVKVDTIDNFVRAHRIAMVDLLKVDAQGTDLDVLIGAEQMIKSHRVRFVLCEVGLQPDDTVNQQFQPLHDHLSSRGLRLCGFYGGGNIGPRWRYACHRDVLYVDPEAVDLSGIQ